MLGTMAGLWISLFLVILGGIMLMGVALGRNSDQEVSVKKHSILHFDLSGEVVDRKQPVSFIQMIQMEDNKTPSLEEMLASLKIAAKDDKIDGLLLTFGGSSMGPASREELIEGIEEFKKTGKWVYAYADNYSQGDYLVASTATSVNLNPIGAVEIHGLGAVVPFYKGLLDKVGVKMQVLKVGTYKSAVEPYVLTGISEPARLQTQQYCDTIWNYISSTIADNRGLTQNFIKELAPKMIFTCEADKFLDYKLVDRLMYNRQNEDALRDLTELDSDEKIRLVIPSDYLKSKTAMSMLESEKTHIAVLYALGEISDSGKEGIVGSAMVDEIVDLADDDDVAGMVLRVNSPGGSAFASEQIWEALEYFKSKNKPLYVSMGDYAASGGYYISCPADSIFTDLTTITGSIGVFGLIPDFSGLVTDKLGVTFSTVETNNNAAGISVLTPMSTDQYDAMQKSVENIYELFTKRVADGRDLEIDYVKSIAEGRVWVGADAVKLGLVDTLGSLDDAIGAMADSMGLTKSDVVAYPRYEEKIWEQFLRDYGIDQINLEFDPETLHAADFLRRLRSANPIQARMPEVIVK